MSLWQSIEESIYQATDEMFSIKSRDSISGGCINEAYRIVGSNKNYFVKINQASNLAMFEAEFKGLEEMAKTRSVRVPAPVVVGKVAGQAYFVMEYIAMGGGSSTIKFGEQLALMHRSSQEKFGWSQDNTIGSTKQVNTLCADWVNFWAKYRLNYQLTLAASKGCGSRLISLGEELIERVPDFFSNYQPEVSLLHGDLWGGNFSTDTNGNPVIYDPATYFGDRETDIAMTELFGGFGQDFFQSYNATWSLDDGYQSRRDLYNVYHILNHFVLFGGGYAHQAERMISSLLAEVE